MTFTFLKRLYVKKTRCPTTLHIYKKDVDYFLGNNYNVISKMLLQTGGQVHYYV
jgi:hypothetical protein